MESNQELSFASACKVFFGMKEGQSLLEFRDEIKALTAEDRAEIKAMLTQQGWHIKE